MRPNVRGSEKLITSSRKISSQLVHVGRVLERVRGVGVVEAAAVGAELLDDLLAGDRAAGDRLLGAAEGGDDLVVQVEVLDRAAGDQEDRADDGDRQQDAQRAAHQVDPEVAQIAGAPAGEPAHQRDRHRHADGGRDEVLHRQPGHLHEMTVGGLTGVGLPVGIGDEADRGVPRQRQGSSCVAGSCRCSGSLPCTSWNTNRNRMLIDENARTLRA